MHNNYMKDYSKYIAVIGAGISGLALACTLKKANVPVVVFEKSSNVIAPTINDKYKNEPHKFIDRLKQFGITDPLGIKLMGEKTPLVSRPGTQVWSG